MPRIVDPVAQRSEIRRAARGVFARRGLKGTGLAHVAEAAGMGRSSLYHYYPDKGALVRDLLGDLVAQEEALFRDAAAGDGTPLARIEGLARTLVGLFGHWSELAPLLFDLRHVERRRFRSFFRRIRAHLATLVVEGQERGEVDAALDPELAAAIAIGAVDGLLIQHYADPRAFDESDLADALAGCLCRGFAS